MMDVWMNGPQLQNKGLEYVANFLIQYFTVFWFREFCIQIDNFTHEITKINIYKIFRGHIFLVIATTFYDALIGPVGDIET